MASYRPRNQQHSHVFAKPSAAAMVKVASGQSTRATVSATRSTLSAVGNLDTATTRTKKETGRVEGGTAKPRGGRTKDVVRVRIRSVTAAANRSTKVKTTAAVGKEDDDSKSVKGVVAPKTKTATTRVLKTTTVSQYEPLNEPLVNKQDGATVNQRPALACVNITRGTTAGDAMKAQAKKMRQAPTVVVVSRIPQVVELTEQSHIRKTDGRYVCTRSRTNCSDTAGLKIHANGKAKKGTASAVCNSNHQLAENATSGIEEQKSKLALHQNRGSQQLEEKHSALPEEESGAQCAGQELVLYQPQADIDVTEDPSLCGEYAGEIYTYHRHLEEEGHYIVCATFLDHQKDITRSHRRVLVDWLVQVHYKYHLLQETMLLTVDILDRYLQIATVAKPKLQLVGIASLFISSKFEEIYSPSIYELEHIAANTYTRPEILAMEKTILRELDYHLLKPYPIHFLRRFSLLTQADVNVHHLAKYFIDLSLLECEGSALLPSKKAAAALILALVNLYGSTARSVWTKKLTFHTGYSLTELSESITAMLSLVQTKHRVDKAAAIREKYIKSAPTDAVRTLLKGTSLRLNTLMQ